MVTSRYQSEASSYQEVAGHQQRVEPTAGDADGLITAFIAAFRVDLRGKQFTVNHEVRLRMEPNRALIHERDGQKEQKEKAYLKEDVTDEEPGPLLVGEEQRLAEDSVREEDDHHENDVVHHFLQHFAHHRHERSQELRYGQEAQDPDVPAGSNHVFVSCFHYLIDGCL